MKIKLIASDIAPNILEKAKKINFLLTMKG